MKINETHPRDKGFVLWGHCQNILDDPRIKLEHCFYSEGWKFKDGVQDGRQLGSLDLSDKLEIKHFSFDFLWMFRGLIIQKRKMEHWFDQKIELFKMVSMMAAILKKMFNLK